MAEGGVKPEGEKIQTIGAVLGQGHDTPLLGVNPKHVGHCITIPGSLVQFAVMDTVATQLILTAAPETAHIALAEIQQLDPNAQLLTWLDKGVAHIKLGSDWDALVRVVRQQPPIFGRHLCPVQTIIKLKQERYDLERISGAAPTLVVQVDPTLSFSVQTRLLFHQHPYGPFNVNQQLAAAVQATGAKLDVRQPQQVLSVVCTQHRAYLGLSLAADNLSDWAGGARRFKQEPEQISRAEFKLLEALEVFQLDMPAGGRALDLGAAPGGWTRVLRVHNLQVVAVDPGDLHPYLLSDPAVTHVRATAHEFLADQTKHQAFEVVVNDMRMDTWGSARLMIQAAATLKPAGLAVMTLKLPGRQIRHAVQRATQLLERSYKIIGARQLFHNRQEITLALRKR